MDHHDAGYSRSVQPGDVLSTSLHVPKPTSDKSTLAADAATAGAIFREFGRTFATYFTKPGALLAIVFMLLYRLPEAFLIKCVCLSWLPPKNREVWNYRQQK